MERLLGIWEVTAQRIIESRQEEGIFPSLSALTRVKGIGSAMVERLQGVLDAPRLLAHPEFGGVGTGVDLPGLAFESIHLAFYSPPYWNYIDYDGGKGIGNKEDTYKEYLDSLGRVNACLFDKIIRGGRVVVNISNMKSRKSIEGISYLMYPITHHLCSIMSEIGFIFYDEIVWDKIRLRTPDSKFLFGSYPYPPTPRIMNSNFENILIFSKDGKRPTVDKAIKEKSKLTKEEWKAFTQGIWRINAARNKNHPAVFPFEVAERIIRLYSFFGDTVIDPFAGVGTTLQAAEKWGRKGIGYEISEIYRENLLF